MLALVLVASLAAAPAPATADILVLDLKPVGVDDTDSRVLDGLLAEAIVREIRRWPKDVRPRVATSNDLRTIITLEASRAAAGCDAADCLADLAGAFGAHYVVTGTIGRLGTARILQVWLYDVTTNQTLERASVDANTTNALAPLLDDLAARVLVPLAPVKAAAPAKKVSSSPVPMALMVTGGGLAAVAGLVTLGAGAAALIEDARLAPRSGATPAEKREAIGYGPAIVATTAVAGVSTAAGLALLGVGVAMGDE